MASTTEVRSGLKYGWALGESGWNGEMDGNIKSIGRFAYHLSVKSKVTTAPPGSPTAGDTYIVGASATGAWAAKDAQVAVWDGAAWVYATARKGWRAFVEDEGTVTMFVTSWVTAMSIYDYKPAFAPTAKTANATLSIAELLTKIVTVTSASAVALTLPTGTLTDAGLSTMPLNYSFDWSVINLGSSSGAVTMAAGTDHTYVGNAVVAISTSATFRTRKTAANTFVTYRIS